MNDTIPHTICRQRTHAENMAVYRAQQRRRPDHELHANMSHPGWEYATTEGPRKAWYYSDVPPAGDGWVRNTYAGRDGWERFEYTEESYWMRPRQADSGGENSSENGQQ